jgi:hypothetical protein
VISLRRSSSGYASPLMLMTRPNDMVDVRMVCGLQ